ncbi:MAG TPA: hypothetical protein ENK18_14985 [Deltaproteobacteria bacterium]|nr:hypothetical protein [Deltaproteobacteria bacterium]
MWFWWVAAVSAQDLIVDGEQLLLHGSAVYDSVQVIHGGVIRVTPYNGESGTGTLILSASRILIDASSRIEGTGSGWPGQIDAAGAGSGAGPAPGSGGSHGGIGAPGRGADCSVIGATSGSLPGDLGPGAAGGGAGGQAGGAGGASVQLIADDIAIYGDIEVSGADGGADAGGGAGGTVLIEADRLVCTGSLVARGGAGGGGGGGGLVEQRWDRSGSPCVPRIEGGASRCGAPGGAGLSVAEIEDWDGDGLSWSAGDCAPRDPQIPDVSDRCGGLDNDCDGRIDEDTGLCGDCQVAQLGSGTYLLCTDQVSWSEARDRCREKGAFELAGISDPLENTLVYGSASSASAGRWWLGGHDDVQEGVYRWLTGEPFAWSSFSPGEPNNTGEEDCLIFQDDPEAWWDDQGCNTNQYPYLCEACPQVEWLEDADGDGVGSWFGATVVGCAPPEGYTDAWGDCDDGDPTRHPGAIELCNGIDDDCDGIIDDAGGTAVRYPDVDGDGFGDDARPMPSSCAAAGLVSVGGDCDDSDPGRGPQAIELCDGIDQDCDGLIDEDGACPCPVASLEGRTYQLCVDTASWGEAELQCQGDGYELASLRSVEENLWLNQQQRLHGLGDAWIGANDQDDEGSFEWSDGTVWSFEHWDTNQPNNSGGADCTELLVTGWWNDQSCGSDRGSICVIDCVPIELYADADGDGFGAPGSGELLCPGTPGWSMDAADCNDADPAIHPGRPEVPADGVDSDCSGADLCWLDADKDGIGGDRMIDCGGASGSTIPGDCNDADPDIYPGAPEVPGDGIDSDCDWVDSCYEDADGDGVPGGLVLDDDLDCANDGLFATGGDCDDTDPGVSTGCVPGPRATRPPLPSGCNCRTQGGSGAGLSLVLGLIGIQRRRAR